MVKQRHRRLLLVVLGVLGAWLLLPNALKRFVRISFAEFQAPIDYTASHLSDLVLYWQYRTREKDDLIEANRDLARMVAANAVARAELESLRAEIRRLENFLNLPSRDDFRYEVARVMRREYAAWWESFTIRKGSRHGLEEGQAVIYGDGVVGRIRQVRSYTAVVELVSSPGFRMAANLRGVDGPVTFRGVFNLPMRPPLGRVENVPPTVELAGAERIEILSSRLGGIFPEGLLIGHLVELEPGEDGYFQQGRVELPDALRELREVAVIVPIEPLE